MPEAEQKIREAFRRLLPDAALEPNPPGYDAHKDFTLRWPGGMVKRYEVKNDFESERSGNAFFESKCLQLTRAEAWLHHLPGRYLLTYCPRRMWAWLLAQDQEPGFHDRCWKEAAGDGNSCGWAVPLYRLRPLVWVGKISLESC